MTDLPPDGYGYCFWHRIYEDDTSCYVICGECFHVFPTEANLVEIFNETAMKTYEEGKAYAEAHPLTPEQEDALQHAIEEEAAAGLESREELFGDGSPPNPVASGEQISFCPLCAHSF